MKKILYVDMDNVLVDFQSGVARHPKEIVVKYEGRLDEIPGIFSQMEPVAHAIASINELASLFDIYVLSTSPWENPTAWTDKLLWVKRHLGKSAYKRLILTHHKNLNRGDFLVDDQTKNGAKDFEGEHIQFGSEKFPNWATVVAYLRERVA
jgi:5'-nucleotidase